MIDATKLELTVKELTTGSLLTNAIEIRDFVVERVKDYAPDRYSGDIAVAKKDRAELNKAAKQINDMRIELERQWMEPFSEFKGVITETTKAIKEASSSIDATIKVVEEKDRNERRAEIEEEFASLDFTLVPLGRIFDNSWLNKSTSRKKWNEELIAAIEKIKTDLTSLDGIDDEADVKAFYLDTLDIGRALQHAKDLKARREAVAPTVEKQEQPAPESTPEDTGDEEPRGPQLMFTLRLTGTPQQMMELREYLDNSGIGYTRVS